MKDAKHLWPDPAPNVEWEVWSEDTFDREARPIKDAGGQGLLDGLTALWLRFLLETIRYEGNQGFTRFYLRHPPAAALTIKGPIDGAARLRYWVFGTDKREISDYLKVADRWLLELIISVHARLLVDESSSEPILKIAVEAADQSRFEAHLAELAGSLGIIVNQADRGDTRRLEPLTYDDKPGKKRVSKLKREARVTKSSRRRIIDYRLIGAAAFMVGGLLTLFLSGHGFALSCERIESTLLDCTLEKNWLGAIVTSRQPVEGLWRARVGQVCNTDGCSMFPELDTANGPVRLEGGSSAKLQPNQDIVDSINAYLSEPGTQEFDIGSDLRFTKLIVPLLLILGGVGFFGAWLLNRFRKA